ncbi:MULTISPECIES: PQQ-binding-like beta-propeller repeat protein [Halobellus]|uniref:outer membrane protein assembly factor BamB family protein n=1 Tax=Halobellus TaxID=1073986 RepID=UPI00211461C3|nr:MULTISPECIES: PQQ-binding-like beta-propeller repeat protein [Halobellus]MDQ2055083.1 PQQ-binding-like beta-propeller repeat protein [Halobellus sp. H-GB7]
MIHNLSRRDAIRLAAVVGGTFAFAGTGENVSGQTADSSTVPMFRYDAHNSGVAPASGPKEDVDDIWTFETGGKLTAQPIVANGRVFQASHDSELYAISTSDGSEVWSAGTNGSLPASPAVGDGVVYQPTPRGRVLAYSAATGNGLWASSVPTRHVKSPTLVGGDLFVAGGEHDFRQAYRLNPNDGAVEWESDLTYLGPIGTPVVDGETVYVTHREDDYYDEAVATALAASDGSQEWQQTLANGGSKTWGITYADGTLYAGTNEGIVYAIDAASGSIDWEFENIASVSTIPVLADGTLYVASTGDNTLHALDPAIGTRQWQVSINGTPTSPVYADGVLYLGAQDNYVYAFDASDGTELWSFQTGGSVVAPPVVVDGRVYAASTDGILYALGEGSGIAAPDVTGSGSPAGDLDGDGRYEDVNGDGAFTATDVQALFANLDSDAVQENPELFDFNGDGQVDITDVQALFKILKGER